MFFVKYLETKFPAMKKVASKSKWIVLIAFSLAVQAHSLSAQEDILKEDFSSLINRKWKIGKAELNGTDVPVSNFGGHTISFQLNGSYSFERFGEVIKGKWRFLEKERIFITDDKDGIERYKVLEVSQEKFVLEGVHPQGKLMIEYVRAD